MANNQMKIAACQLLTSEDVSANTAKVLQQIETCAEMEIQIAAFPEGCLFGYCCRTDYWEHISPQVFIVKSRNKFTFYEIYVSVIAYELFIRLTQMRA